ncbi:MAG: KH domain-containing protein [Dehalococcoidia bacterium]|nr:KH domain-containing protein [Dehalococcoidia bacterium]
MEQQLETSGKTVDEAVEEALLQLGLNREQVDVEVITAGTRGRFGLGGDPARVIVRPRDGASPAEPTGVPPSPAAAARPPRAPRRREQGGRDSEGGEPLPFEHEAVGRAQEVLRELLRYLDLEASVTARRPESPGDGIGQASAVLDIASEEDLGLLIGRKGTTLAALQYMVNLITTRGMTEPFSVTIDVEGYRKRREHTLNQLAQRAAERAVTTHTTVTMEPMPANERRIIHIALADHPQVMTKSIGGGEDRHVAVSLR